jgi:CBS domain containing-hemolysin-like protein
MTDVLLLVLAGALVLACGGFVAAEFSFVTVDRSIVDRAAEAGDRRAQGVQQALRSLSTQLSGAQVGITLTNLAIGYLAEPAVAHLVRGPLTDAGVPESSVPGIAVAIGLLVGTVATMIFGELVPKNLAIARPMATAKATQGLQRGFTTAMRGPIRLLNGSANWLVRRLGIEPQEELRSARSSQELASLIGRSASVGTLDPDTAGLLQRSVAFAQRTAEEIMTPRVQMSAAKPDQPVAAVIELARTTGHSRFPVVAGEADDVVGAVHVKHAVAVPREDRGSTAVRDVMVPPTVVPGTLRLDPLLAQLREEGYQVAVVVDEYGGTAGVVTLEDVVEEIVGEIADEHDPLDRDVRRHGDGSWSLSGLLRPDEVADRTGVRLPEHEDYDTVAGLFLRHHGRLPDPGEAVVVEQPPTLGPGGEPEPARVAVLTVERMAGRRIDRVRLESRPAGGRAEP